MTKTRSNEGDNIRTDRGHPGSRPAGRRGKWLDIAGDTGAAWKSAVRPGHQLHLRPGPARHHDGAEPGQRHREIPHGRECAGFSEYA